MGKSGHLRVIARSPFPQWSSRARNIFRGGRSLCWRKMGKSGHLYVIARSPFPQRSSRTRNIFRGGRSLR
eukprot:2279958-Ditylum_brightwellii.AAC.1